MTRDIVLRDVTARDIPIFFEHQRDTDASRMAAFTAKDSADRVAFTAHWTAILGDDTIPKKTIIFDGQVVGNIVSFAQFGEREVGYWIGKEYWGKGIATKALSAFLRHVTVRPLFARAAKDNSASIRVLEKCGFVVTGVGKAFANARGEAIAEVILTLEAGEENETY